MRARLDDRELADVLTDLAALPANVIVRASQEIAKAAGLGWSQPQIDFSLGRLFGKSSQLRLLRQNADYAWLFLFHPSGYVREAALDTVKDPPSSPFFLSAWLGD